MYLEERQCADLNVLFAALARTVGAKEKPYVLTA